MHVYRTEIFLSHSWLQMTSFKTIVIKIDDPRLGCYTYGIYKSRSKNSTNQDAKNRDEGIASLSWNRNLYLISVKTQNRPFDFRFRLSFRLSGRKYLQTLVESLCRLWR